MTERIEVDPDGLVADGQKLASIGDPLKPSGCAAPGSDMVSSRAALILIEHEDGLVVVTNYASLLRDQAGAVIHSVAVMFVVADEKNALNIQRVTVHAAPGITDSGAPAMPAVPPAPRQPPIPRIPKLLGLPNLPGEVFAEQLHGGPGSGSIRNLSDDWLDNARGLLLASDDARFVAGQIDADWFDGKHNAANNVRSHGEWLESASRWADRLGIAAEGVAHSFDEAENDCPTPDQFKHARQNMEYQAKRNSETFGLNAAGVAKALEEFNRLQDQAVRAMTKYYSSVSAAIDTLGDPIVPPPPIAKQGVLPSEVVRGPGEWVAERRGGGSTGSRAYEEQVTGAPADMEYELPRGDGQPGRTDFDGYDPDAGPDGLLFEAKGENYDWMVGPDGNFKPELGPARDIPQQLGRQYSAAELAGGVPVEWRVAEPRVAIAIERLVDTLGYDDLITVVFVPPR
ncbi:PPE domain-containing protein [Mycobacterium sp. 236(2023)]|uniref:PPE domain-containing protein n=1 Tax=Mycobacterium sp. 236(2023) TaxID=3038163 RepID=UPI00241580EF|nr:PPE domain-containing protein [Mycobacterium sp. 236(2023)]MDG4668645.1 PPE domain-containing protein [Mycobacterium sp. 236(2023)]